MKKYAIGCGVVLLLVLLVGGLMVGGSYNKLVGLKQNTDSKWAAVESLYQRRADLVPNLVSTVQGAANFEKSTITEVTEARASVGKIQITPGQAPETAEQLEKFEKAQGQLGTALSRLLVVAERYPELRATQSFRDLQAQLEGTENRIAVGRMDFNEAVQAYNTAAQRFPTVIWAKMLGFGAKPYFSSQPGAENAPKVQFPDFKK